MSAYSWEPDRGLQARMAVTVLLILLFPFAFVYAMAWIFTDVVPVLAVAFVGIPLDPGVGVDLTTIGVLVVLGIAAQWTVGDRLALRSLGAERVEREAAPELHAAVDRLSRQADVPTPDVAIVESDAPNAFAIGRRQEDATVAVTEGLAETLDDDELEAVLAHELAHVKNRDAAIMTVAYVLPTLTVTIMTVAYKLLGPMARIAARSMRSRSRNGRGAVALVALFFVTALLTMAVSALFWVGSFLMFRLLSRYREYAADRAAARLTGDPYALATALERLDETLSATPDRDLRRIDGGVEALYVAPLGLETFDREDDDALISRDVFPETHPPTSERVERLRELGERP